MRGRSPLDSIAALSVALIVTAAVAQGAQGPSTGTAPGVRPASKSFSDAEIDSLIGALDAALGAERNPAKWAASARLPLWDFARQLQAGPLTPRQEARALDRLAAIRRAHPDAAGAIDGAQRMVSALGVGKTAPDISGADLDGKPFRLSDYRGRVVALLFSGDWCGICRSDYPYTRELLARFGDAPLTVLGVDSSRTLADARRVKASERLAYRSWWDGGGARHSDGPIARAWNVVGWPTVYVIDAAGVIRFVDVRREHLLGAVEHLLNTTDGQERIGLQAR